jgi:hypothetical protein
MIKTLKSTDITRKKGSRLTIPLRKYLFFRLFTDPHLFLDSHRKRAHKLPLKLAQKRGSKRGYKGALK